MTPEDDSHPSSDVKTPGQVSSDEDSTRVGDRAVEALESRVDDLLSRERSGDDLVGVVSRPSESSRAGPQRSPAPAEGERNAVVGYLGQYELAAVRTLDALHQGSLEAVRLADIRAGQIDDFQLVTRERVDAHQVKWSLHPGTVGFAELVNDTADQKAYIRQLADGWLRLRALHASRRVIVHLVTNDIPSSANNPSIPRPPASSSVGTADSGFAAPPRVWSLAAFVGEAWRPAVEAARAGADPSAAVPTPWSPAMDLLRQASGLAAGDWSRFIADCEFEFGAPSLSSVTSSAPVAEAERRTLRRDADDLAHAFMRLVAQPDRRIEFARDALLDFLGWRHRVEFRNPHEFPDPTIPYRAVAATAREITEAVERAVGGYVMVSGSPGSGKSTLLTRLLRDSPHRVIRYYAFVPDAPATNVRRGEAVNFLHDVTTALARSGVQPGITLPTEDLDLLARRFHDQLRGLHDEWREAGRRTLILVDGLDHITREQSPVHSLLTQLPPPDAVPDGVLFILGSQTDLLPGLSARVRDQLTTPGRRIAMRPLERADVIDIITGAEDLAPAPDAEAAERIFRLSAGHPLALNYIVNRLRHARGTSVQTVLDEVEPFEDRIDVQYATIWTQLESDVELARLLALLARARGPVRLTWLRRWAPRQALHDVTTRLSHYFRQERGARWGFFHNSFRAFLLDRTRGLPAVGEEAELYSELAHQCATAEAREPERADELNYRARAGDTAAVLSLGDPAAFRDQFVAGRSASAILDDTLLVIDASVAQRDPVALIRALLARAEFAQRSRYEERLPLAETRLDLGDLDLALDGLREGSELRTTSQLALQAAARLYDEGNREEARELFALAEPLNVLRGTQGMVRMAQRDESQLLGTWARVAPRFRRVESILAMIDDVGPDYPSRRGGELARADDEASAATRRFGLHRSLIHGLDDLGRWDDADDVLNRLRGFGEGALGWWFWAQCNGWRAALAAGKRETAERRLGEVSDAVSRGEPSLERLDSNARMMLAEGLLRVRNNSDGALELLQKVQQPASVTEYGLSGESGFALYRPRFYLNRLLAAVGVEPPLSDVVPDLSPGGQNLRGEAGAELLTRFERGVVLLARLEGRLWVGGRPQTSEFAAAARPLLRLFPESAHLVYGAYPALQARDEFYVILVRFAARCGPEGVSALQKLLDAEWTDPARRNAWPPVLIRSVVSAMIAAGAPRAWTVRWLEHIEPLTFRGEELETELEEGVKQTRSWIIAGDVAAARSCLDRVLRATFGNENKDTQLATCVSWAKRANQVDPAGAPERLAQLASATASMEDTEGSGYVASTVLKAGIAVGAPVASALAQWMLRHGVKGWVAALTTLVEGLAASAPAAAATASAFYRTLVLPLGRGAELGAVAQLGAGLHLAAEDDELRSLSDAIEVSALGSIRPALRAALAGRAEEAAESIREKEGISDPTALNQVVDAFDGLSLTLRELQERTRTPDHVADLVRRLKPNAYSHRWSLILKPLVAAGGPDELFSVAERLPADDRAWEALADIGERLRQVGDSRAAHVARRVLRASHPAGWVRRWDGGSRLRAYELLVSLSPEEGRAETWAALRGDILGGEVGAADLFHGWDRIVPLLVDRPPDLDIWAVVSRHVEALMAWAPRYERPLLPAAADPTDHAQTVDALMRIAAAHLDHPAYALSQGAQRFFLDRVLAGDAAADDVLMTRLRNPSVPNDGALLVLRAARLCGHALSSNAVDLLRQLRLTPNYRDRRAVDELLGLEPHTVEIAQVLQPLPAAFNIVHPPARPFGHRLARRGDPLPSPASPADLVAVFQPELDLVAEMAQVQPEAFYAYVAELAVDGVQGGLAADEEPELRDHLRAVGLEITYRRPRPIRVERAMLQAVAMLLDRGRLTARHVGTLDRLLRNTDPAFVAARPIARPDVVLPIPERGASQYVGEGWTAAANPEFAAIGRHLTSAAGAGIGELLVIAEESWLRWLDWKRATETRVGACLEFRRWSPPAARGRPNTRSDDNDQDDGLTGADEALSSRVPTFSHLLASEYVSRARSPLSIVVRNHVFRFETPGAGWLAFNPALAESLGWRPAESGLFRWVDDSGALMAESVWWEDGFVQHRPPLFEDEIGRGWLVLVSARAWSVVKDAVGETIDWCAVQRLAQEQSPLGVECWRLAGDAVWRTSNLPEQSSGR